MAKIVVIGGTGNIGKKLVSKLSEHGHVAQAASPSTGVDAVTGKGVAEALNGADVVIDVSQSPSFAPAAVLDFFQTGTTNLLEAARDAGVKHYVALSVVGAQRLDDSPYLHAKHVQQTLIEESGLPYTIVQATQFFEFIGTVAAVATDGDTVRASSALIQPIASGDVAAAVGRTAVGEPQNATIEIGGPEEFPIDELLRKTLAHRKDPRTVVTDPEARYFGAALDKGSLVTGEGATIFETRYPDWLAQN